MAFQQGILIAAFAGTAYAQVDDEDPIKSAFEIDDLHPEKSVPTLEQANKRPLDMGYLIMQLSERAEAASKNGMHLAAAKYWRAIAKAVPDRALGYSKACAEYEAARDYESAAQNCRAALGLSGVTVDDNVRFVTDMLKKKSALEPKEIEDIDAVIAHLQKELGKDQGPLTAYRLRCELGVRLEDVKRMQLCTYKLNKLAPNDPQTVVYSWSLAIKRGDFNRADQLIDRAEELKLPHAALETLRDTTDAERERRWPWWQRALHDKRVRAAAALVAALALGVSAALFGRRRLRAHTA